MEQTFRGLFHPCMTPHGDLELGGSDKEKEKMQVDPI